jgi:Uma2 family endonuclease
MTTLPSNTRVLRNDYPTSDGKPMAETERHRDLMIDLIRTLQDHWHDQPRMYVSGNLLVFYEPGNRRRHVSPDVFVVRGVGKHIRLNYLIWEEGRGPQAVIELTSSTTRNEDLRTKFTLYQDTLKVREYFLFDPHGDYLDPPLRGYRLRQGQYRPIRAVQERLPSQVMGLHLERDGPVLRLWNPATGIWLPTPQEARRLDAQARQKAEERAEQAEAENERLRQELARLRGGPGKNGT